MEEHIVRVNRAPVLTLWGAVVAERLGHDRAAALTLGKAVAGLNAQSKGRSLGIFGPPPASEGGAARKKAGLGEELWIAVCGRSVPAKNTPAGLRAVVKDKPIEPQSVDRYLESAFGDALNAVRSAMERLAAALSPRELEEEAYPLYEKFRPPVAAGARGWGQKGELDLRLIQKLATRS